MAVRSPRRSPDAIAPDAIAPEAITPEESEPSSEATQQQRADFLLDLGRELHRQGVPSHRLELALDEVASRLGLAASFHATPTALFATVATSRSGTVAEQTHLQRMQPGSVSLGTMVELDRLAQLVADGDLGVVEARRQLAVLADRSPRYPPWLNILSFALASACASRLFGAGGGEMVTALVCGALVGALARSSRSRPTLLSLFQPLGAFLVAITAGLLASVSPLPVPVNVPIATLAGLIVLVPGLTVTIAVSELANGSWVSGTSRLFAAILTFFMLGFGVALGSRVVTGVGGPWPEVVLITAPTWTAPIAAVLTAIAFTVLLDADRRDLPWIVLAGLLTWTTAGACSPLGVEVASLLGALMLGVVSNVYARTLRRPALVVRVAAVLLLVPGAIGFRGVASFMVDDAVSGAEAAFTMALVAVAIVLGQLMANALVSPRRLL